MRPAAIKNAIVVAIVLSLGMAGSRTALAQPELVVELRLDEPGGTIAKDSSGNGNDAVLVGEVEHVLAYNRLGVRIHGEGEYIEIPKSLSDLGINTGEPWTAGVWVNPIYNGGTLLDVAGVKLGVGEEVGKGTLTFEQDPTQNSEFSAHAVSDTWMHVGLVCEPSGDPETSRIRIYVDGVEIPSPVEVPQDVIDNDKSPILVGEGSDGPVDDIVIFRGVNDRPASRDYEGRPGDAGLYSGSVLAPGGGGG